MTLIGNDTGALHILPTLISVGCTLITVYQQ